MSESIIIYVVAPLVVAFIGGIKYILNRIDKKIEAERTERDKRRDKIEREIELLKTENKRLQVILLGCDKPDCPAKLALKKYYEEININV